MGFDGTTPAREDSDPTSVDTCEFFEADRFEATGPREPRFEPGDGVVIGNDYLEGYMKAPRYVRDAPAEVRKVDGTFYLSDAVVERKTELEPCYSLTIDAN